MSPDDLSREVVDSLLGRGELIVRFLSRGRRSDGARGGWRSSKGKEGSPPPRAGAQHQPVGPRTLIRIHTRDHHVRASMKQQPPDVKRSPIWQPGGQSDASHGAPLSLDDTTVLRCGTRSTRAKFIKTTSLQIFITSRRD